jgi:hypothetical protein
MHLLAGHDNERAVLSHQSDHALHRGLRAGGSAAAQEDQRHAGSGEKGEELVAQRPAEQAGSAEGWAPALEPALLAAGMSTPAFS